MFKYFRYERRLCGHPCEEDLQTGANGGHDRSESTSYGCHDEDLHSPSLKRLNVSGMGKSPTAWRNLICSSKQCCKGYVVDMSKCNFHPVTERAISSTSLLVYIQSDRRRWPSKSYRTTNWNGFRGQQRAEVGQKSRVWNTMESLHLRCYPTFSIVIPTINSPTGGQVM